MNGTETVRLVAEISGNKQKFIHQFYGSEKAYEQTDQSELWEEMKVYVDAIY